MVFKYRFRLYLFSLALLGGFCVLVLRLWSLQIDRHAEFVKKVPGTRQLKVRVPGVRGEIKDCNGITLASNKPSFEVRVNLKDVMDAYKRHLEVTKGTMATTSYEVVDKGMRRKKEEADIAVAFNEMIVSRLNEMGLAEAYNAVAMRAHYRTFHGLVPWVYRSDLTFEEFSRFAEHNLGLPGLSVAVRPVRQYLYGSLACHVLGYVSLPDDQRVSSEERQGWDFFVPDDFGVTGVEKSFDGELKGKPGVRTMLQNELRVLVGEVSYEEPRKGNDVYLTIDARIQIIAEKALREANNGGGIGRGAIVVIDPSNGEVRAMASVPSYDPNKFIPQISVKDYQQYLKNPVNPLFNRAVQGYAPGSTFKIPISFAGCLAGIQQYRFTCNGGVTYGSNYMKCWIASKGGAHGSLDLSDAIMQSCNCFFYQYGNRAGIDNITRVGKLLGVGEKTGIELDDETSGVLPNPQWLRLHKPQERWSNGYTANTSIGQGFVLASPLQMASVGATVASSGKSFRPHLLKRVMDGDELVRENPPDLRADLAAEGVAAKDIELIRRGMWKVVNAPGGTAKGARIEGVEVAGKTGTAQFKRKGQPDNHTWFMCFAPYQSPKYACCVLVQGGKSGGGCAAPVAKRVLEQALALDNGYQVAIETIPEVQGNFEPIEQVAFEATGPLLAQNSDDDGDVGSQVPTRESQDEAPSRRPAASVRREADSTGSQAVNPNQSVPKAVPVRKAGFFQRLFKRE